MGWDVAALAANLRKAAGDDPMPAHNSLVRMIWRWERDGMNKTRARAERYELLYRSLGFGTTPGGAPSARPTPATSPVPDVSAAIAGALHTAPGNAPERGRAALERDVRRAWKLRQSARYAELGTLTADLLTHTASGQADPDLTVHVCNMGSSLLKSLGVHEMAAMLADRAFLAASMSGDRLLLGAAQLRVANVYLSAGRQAEAVAVAAAAADALPPGRSTSASEAATFGALLLTAAVAAAKLGQSAQAWEFLGQARTATGFVGQDHADLFAVFGPANLAVHRVQVATELRDGREALRRAGDIDPGGLPDALAERRATLLIDIARAHGFEGNATDAGATLLEAERVAPLEVRYSPASRELVGQLLAGPRVSGDVRALAGRLNVAV